MNSADRSELLKTRARLDFEVNVVQTSVERILVPMYSVQ